MSRRPRRSHPVAPLLLAFLLLTSLFTSAAIAESDAESNPQAVDAKAVAVAERTLEAMGGADAWAATRFLRFDFFGFRLHHWDRYTGRHRLEGETREGVKYVVLHDIDSHVAGAPEGEVYLDGELATGEDRDQWLERAYGAWINDTYWLVMPYKLLDPGVHLAYEGEEEVDGKLHDVLRLSFDSVGLTPGDQYWAYIDRETGLMSRWAYFLESYEEGAAPTAWRWLDWQSYGGIQLSSKREKVDDGVVRMLGQIAVLEHLGDAIFTEP